MEPSKQLVVGLSLIVASVMGYGAVVRSWEARQPTIDVHTRVRSVQLRHTLGDSDVSDCLLYNGSKYSPVAVDIKACSQLGADDLVHLKVHRSFPASTTRYRASYWHNETPTLKADY